MYNLGLILLIRDLDADRGRETASAESNATLRVLEAEVSGIL
jgi:hypothetical protein